MDVQLLQRENVPFLCLLGASLVAQRVKCLPAMWDSLPLGLALGSPIFPSGCEGKLGVALESLQGLRDLT